MTSPTLSADAERQQFLADVLAGLDHSQRQLPCKYFYDAEGSRLFDAICELPEYYPTRTELSIMSRHAGEMADSLGSGCLLIEFGSGSSVKTRLLLDRLREPAGYVPIDVSGEHLELTAVELQASYPSIPVKPLCADFTQPLDIPPLERKPRRRAVYFPGSTIGNFAPNEADDLLQKIADLARPGGALLLGVDLWKDVEVLERAYNDAAGVTAAFNLNLLTRINRELGADFDTDAFRHQATFNGSDKCIEIHLVSQRDQTVTIAGKSFSFRKGESIRTERSHKYYVPDLARRAAAYGLRLDRSWTDDRNYFSVLYFSVTE